MFYLSYVQFNEFYTQTNVCPLPFEFHNSLLLNWHNIKHMINTQYLNKNNSIYAWPPPDFENDKQTQPTFQKLILSMSTVAFCQLGCLKEVTTNTGTIVY